MESEEVSSSDLNLAVLFDEYASSLVRLGLALTGDLGVAEDLVQEAFAQLAKQKSTPRPNAEIAYLRKAVINQSHNRFRHLGVVRRHDRATNTVASPAEDEAINEDIQKRVLVAIRQLPKRQRDCIVMRCYLESTDSEISDALDISVGSVKTHLRRGRAALAKTLEDLR